MTTKLEGYDFTTNRGTFATAPAVEVRYRTVTLHAYGCAHVSIEADGYTADGKLYASSNMLYNMNDPLARTKAEALARLDKNIRRTAVYLAHKAAKK